VLTKVTAAVLVSLIACGGAEPVHTITGSITVMWQTDDPDLADSIQRTQTAFAIGAPCTGASVSRGYADVGPGIDVTVKDETGTIIATGAVEEGTWERRACRLPFSIPDVEGAEFYELELGRRGSNRYSAAELASAGYEVHLTLGG
jgi:hypothetical protein